MTHNRKKTIILNNIEQHILKNVIVKFGVWLMILKVCLYMIEYNANLICCFYGVFKKFKVYLDMLNAKI